MSESSVPAPRPSEPVTVLPDGSAFFVGTLPLPSDHWLYAPEYQPPPMGLRMSVSNPQRIEMVRHVTDAVRWAVRGATMKGTVADFDPDALVQTAVVGLLGYFAKDALSNDAWANPSPVPDETFVVRSPSVPTATQEQRDADEVAWLIERGQREGVDPPQYWADRSGTDRTTFPKFAFRFVTRLDAEKALRAKGHDDGQGCDSCGRPVEHVFIVPAVSSSEEAANSDTPQKLHGVVWALIGDSDGRVVLERCEKKARVLGVGEWFLPGGKIEGDETPEECLRREIREEWPDVELLTARPLPIVEGSSVPPGPRGLFLMRPFVVTVRGEVPSHSSEGTPLRWASVAEALFSPVAQVRMIVAAARVQGENSQ